jgi:hypothetical protein
VAEFIAGGRGVELVLWLMVAEALALAIHHRVTRRGVAPTDFLANLAAGMLLLLAMRFALGGAWWGWVSLCLLAALAAHLADLFRRWRH